MGGKRRGLWWKRGREKWRVTGVKRVKAKRGWEMLRIIGGKRRRVMVGRGGRLRMGKGGELCVRKGGRLRV